MAESEVLEEINRQKLDIECIVNRWLVDYYLFLAIENFKSNQYSHFCGVRDVLDTLLSRPLESTDVMPLKIRVLQFLSRINDGDKLDMSFDTNESISPLESAIEVLGNIGQECSVSQQDLEKIRTSIKEMLVVICIKNKEFEKAKEVLNNHFPKGMVGKKAIFMGLVNQKRKTHEVLEQITFQKFKEEMVQFCESLYPQSTPFLHKAAKQLINKRLVEQEDDAAEPQPEEPVEPTLSPGPLNNTIQFVPCDQTVIQKRRLEMAYMSLAKDSTGYKGPGITERTLAMLEEEMEKGVQSKRSKDGLSLLLSDSSLDAANREPKQDAPSRMESASPMEASPTRQAMATDAVPPTEAGPLAKTASPIRSRRPYTVAQLVVEPDSQLSSQCSTASQEQGAQVGKEEAAQLLATSDEADPPSPVTDNETTKSRQKRTRSTRPSSSSNKKSTKVKQLSDSEEEDPFGSDTSCKTPVRKIRKRSASTSLPRNSTKLKQMSADSEEDPHGSADTTGPPVQNLHEQQASRNSEDSDDLCIDSSYDSSPNRLPINTTPQKSSTPQKDSALNKGACSTKWKNLYKNAKEAKEIWSDEESLFNCRDQNDKQGSKRQGDNSSISSSSSRKKTTWTYQETQMLRDAVAIYGEGNWSKIQSKYSFGNRTNVNLKDRWRTMKKLNLV